MSRNISDWSLLSGSRFAPEGAAPVCGERVVFEGVEALDFEAFKEFLSNSRHFKLRYHYYPALKELHVKPSSHGHEGAVAFLSSTITLWNDANFPTHLMRGIGPVKCFGTANVANTTYESDSKYQLQGRGSENLVLEVASEIEERRTVIEDCKDYFALTPHVMITIAIKYWKLQDQKASIAMLIYERDNIENGSQQPFNRGVLRKRISFGTDNIQENSLTAMNDAINSTPNPFPGDGLDETPWVGKGFPGAVDCDRVRIPLYQIELPSRLLLCLDNRGIDGSPFYNNVALNALVPSVVIDLYVLQQAMIEAMQLDV